MVSAVLEPVQGGIMQVYTLDEMPVHHWAQTLWTISKQQSVLSYVFWADPMTPGENEIQAPMTPGEHGVKTLMTMGQHRI